MSTVAELNTQIANAQNAVGNGQISQADFQAWMANQAKLVAAAMAREHPVTTVTPTTTPSPVQPSTVPVTSPLGPEPGSPQYYTQGSYVASHTGAPIEPRYNPPAVTAAINAYQVANPGVQINIPADSVPVAFDSKTGTVQTITTQQYADYQSSVKYYTAAGYPEFAGKYAPLDIPANKITSLKEVPVSVPVMGPIRPGIDNPVTNGAGLEYTTPAPTAPQAPVVAPTLENIASNPLGVAGTLINWAGMAADSFVGGLPRDASVFQQAAGVALNLEVGAAGLYVNQAQGVKNFVGGLVGQEATPLSFTPRNTSQEIGGYAAQVGEIAATVIVAPYLAPVTMAPLTATLLTAGGAGANVAIGEAIRFLPDNPVTGPRQGNFNSVGGMLDEAVQGGAFSAIGLGTMRATSFIASRGVPVLSRTAQVLGGVNSKGELLITGKAMAARTGMSTVTQAGLGYATGGVQGAVQGTVFGAVLGGAGEVGGKLAVHAPDWIVEHLGFGGVKGTSLELREIKMQSSVETAPVKQGNIAVGPRDDIVDIPYEGAVMGEPSVRDIMAENGVGGSAASRVKTVTVTTVEAVPRRVTYAEAVKFQNIEDMNVGKIIDIAGEQTVSTYQKPLFESEVGVDASGRFIAEVDAYGNMRPLEYTGIVKPSEIHGSGVFAGTNLAEGTIVRSPTENIDASYAPGMNWSDTPNTVRKIYLDSSGNIKSEFVTTRVIKTGEEFTVPNYGSVDIIEENPMDAALGLLRKENKLGLWQGNSGDKQIVLTTTAENGKVITHADVITGNRGATEVKFVSPSEGEVTTYGSIDLREMTKVGIAEQGPVKTPSKPNLINMADELSSAELNSAKENFLDVSELNGDITGVPQRVFSNSEIKYDEAPKIIDFNPQGNLSHTQKYPVRNLLTDEQIRVGESTIRDNTTLGEALGRPFGDNRTAEVTSLIATDDITTLRKAVLGQKAGEQFSETRVADPYLATARGDDYVALKEVGVGKDKHIVKLTTGEANLENAVTQFRFENGMDVPGAVYSEFDVELPSSKKNPVGAVMVEETHISHGGAGNPKLVVRDNMAFKLRAKIPDIQDVDVLLMKGTLEDGKTTVPIISDAVRDEIVAKYKIGEMEGAPRGVGEQFDIHGNKLKFTNEVGDIISDNGRTTPIGNAGPTIEDIAASRNAGSHPYDTEANWVGENIQTNFESSQAALHERVEVPRGYESLANFRDFTYNVLGDKTVGNGLRPKGITLEQWNAMPKGKAGEKPFVGYVKLDEFGNILRDVNGNPIYEGYSAGSTTAQKMAQTGPPVPANQQKYRYIDVPSNLISVDWQASQRPLNLPKITPTTNTSQKPREQTYTQPVASFDASMTDINQQTTNPFIGFKGRSYYKQNPRSYDDYEYAYGSVPNSGLGHPQDLSNNAFVGRGTSENQRTPIGIEFGQGYKPIQNNRQDVTVGNIFGRGRNIRGIYGTVGDLGVGFTPIIGEVPIQGQPQIPIQHHPTPPIPIETQHDLIIQTDDFRGTRYFAPAFGSKFEGFGGGSLSIGKRQGVRSYKYENPILEGAQLLGF